MIGELANTVRDAISHALEEKTEDLRAKALDAKLAAETLDVTLPGASMPQGHLHPLTQVINDAKRIFTRLGFEVAEGPEIESDYYNFEALNLPPDHPARDMQDTFYINNKVVLRTQTSGCQVHAMERMQGKLPVKIIAPGRVYRRDDDATHSPMFHQIEGLLVDEHITMADLKGVLLAFAREMFGQDVKIRLRPSYFPFTEPSAEMDISCHLCGGKGCGFCKHTGWVEILGCGMVDPNVLESCGIDSKVYSGFALGMGVERITNLKYRVKDLRMFSENDVRFLDEFESVH